MVSEMSELARKSRERVATQIWIEAKPEHTQERIMKTEISGGTTKIPEQTPGSGMSELVRKSQTCVAKAGPALDRAAQVATALKLERVEKDLKGIRIALERDRFTVLMFGRFKCGKSTILNALLGKPLRPIPDLPAGCGPLPVDVNPATAVGTRISYAEEPAVTVVRKGRKKEKWSFTKFLEQGKQRGTADETRQFFSDIDSFEVEFPTAFCKSGVELLDSPGTDDNPDMDLLTFQAAKEADAAVLALSHPATFGEQEKQYLEDLLASGLKSYLTVVNARDPDPPSVKAMPPSDTTKASVWDRIVTRFRQKGKYAGQPLEAEDIYFLNALQAFKGRMADDEGAVQESSILEFERRLAEYLETEPRYVHLQRFLGAAEPLLDKIEEVIGKECAALETDEETFQMRLAELQPKLAEVPKRAKRIPGIIRQHRIQAQAALQQSLEELYGEIEQDLPAHMESQKIPSLHKENLFSRLWELIKSRLFQKQLCKEAMDIAIAYLRSRVKEWQENPPTEKGAQQALKVHMENMIEELKAEAAAIERQYTEAQIALTGWTPPEAVASAKRTNLASRVTAAAFGAITGNVDYVFLGGLAGWGGVFRDMLGRIAITTPLVFVFHLALPVALPIAIVGGVVWSIIGGTGRLETNIKTSAVNALLKGYPKQEGVPAFAGLANEPRRMRETIAAAVGAKFDEIESRVMKVIRDQIQIEEESLRNQQADLLKNTGQRAKTLEALNSYQTKIQSCRADLKQAWTSAAQVGKGSSMNQAMQAA
jgi:hypothetical protein